MAYNSTKEYLNIVDILTDAYNIPKNITDPLLGYLKYIHRSEVEDRLSAPMLWIGMYIALASLVCIVAMVADLVHGLRSRKLWFPSKYFRINSAFLTVISVAMKLPVDLTGLMPGYNVDQVAKVGSMAFMCTMMANLLPCLGTMESNELFSNTIAFCVLVVTLVVNVCISGSIQTQMGSLSISMYRDSRIIQLTSLTDISDDDPTSGLAFIYVTLLVVLLIIHICSSLAVLKSMQIIEDRYEEGHDKALADIQPSPGEIVTVEMLKKHVENHWIMAESSSSLHFITTCFYTTSASGVICLLVTILHTFTMFRTIQDIFTMEWDSGFSWSMMLKYCESDYGWSMMVIVIVQSMGVVIGTIAPLSRCFATLSFKVNYKMITNHFKVFKVNGYWTQKLYEWKHASIRLPFRIRSLEVVLETFKRLILNICIGFQMVVVVVCKVIALFPFLFMICCCCKKSCCCFKKSEESEGINDLSGYVLYLEDGMEVGERYLERLSKSVNRLIQKGAKSHPSNLVNLIREKSTSGFEGVIEFDRIDVPCVDSWRLPVVTLTTIILSLPEIGEDEVDSLLESVREGLEYVMVVEKSLNAKRDCLGFQKAAATLWQEIRFDKKWLGNQLQNSAFQGNTAEQIVRGFRDKANNIISSEDRSKDDTRVEYDDSRHKLICANSMYRITETILRSNDVTVSPKELFDSLSKMIADIIASCLTNLPQAITMKCHTSVRKERKASVYAAAQLLGETKQIIETLRVHHIPYMDQSDLPFIKKWRSYLGNP